MRDAEDRAMNRVGIALALALVAVVIGVVVGVNTSLWVTFWAELVVLLLMVYACVRMWQITRRW